MAVLLRDPKRVLTGHEVPRHGGMAGGVGVPVTQPEGALRAAPTLPLNLKAMKRLAVRMEEDLLMVDVAGQLELVTERELSLDAVESARAKLNEPVRSGLRMVLVVRINARLGDADLLRMSQLHSAPRDAKPNMSARTPRLTPPHSAIRIPDSSK